MISKLSPISFKSVTLEVSSQKNGANPETIEIPDGDVTITQDKEGKYIVDCEKEPFEEYDPYARYDSLKIDTIDSSTVFAKNAKLSVNKVVGGKFIKHAPDQDMDDSDDNGGGYLKADGNSDITVDEVGQNGCVHLGQLNGTDKTQADIKTMKDGCSLITWGNTEAHITEVKDRAGCSNINLANGSTVNVDKLSGANNPYGSNVHASHESNLNIGKAKNFNILARDNCNVTIDTMSGKKLELHDNPKVKIKTVRANTSIVNPTVETDSTIRHLYTPFTGDLMIFDDKRSKEKKRFELVANKEWVG